MCSISMILSARTCTAEDGAWTRGLSMHFTKRLGQKERITNLLAGTTGDGRVGNSAYPRNWAMEGPVVPFTSMSAYRGA